MNKEDKKVSVQRLSVDFMKWDVTHYKRGEQYAKEVANIYEKATSEAARMSGNIAYNPDKQFNFDDYPETKNSLDKMLNNLSSSVNTVIKNSTRKEWLFACQKNDEIVNRIFNNPKAKKILLDKYYERNIEAMNAFQQRRTEGMTLSDRIWRGTEQFRQELELGIDIGLGEGRSADELSRDLRNNLNDPENLFRRVRNSRGNLGLSKAAKAYHPGQGVYRSSYKNAMRLTRTETNMAYRTADYNRWQQMDYVNGVEVKLSNNHTLNGEPFVDICDELAGKYPKEFKFTGWHPQCRCFVIPILADLDDFIEYEKKILAGDDVKDYTFNGKIKELPKGFNSWVGENKTRIAYSKSLPYFIKDNQRFYQLNNAANPVSVIDDAAPFVMSKEKAIELKKLGYKIPDDVDEFVSSYNNSPMSGFDIVQFDKELTESLSLQNIEVESRRITAKGGIATFTIENNKGFQLTRDFFKASNSGRKTVEHSYFVLPKNVQGKGLSKSVFKSLYKQYKKAGITDIEVHANIDVGGYTWGKYGFTISKRGIQSLLETQLRKGKIDNKIFDTVNSQVKTFFDENKEADRFPMNLLASSDYGKKTLLGSNWGGALDLTDKEQRRVFEDYLFSRAVKK